MNQTERIFLANAVYVPQCPLSMVSVQKLQDKGVIWDTERQTIRFDSQNGGRDLYRVIRTDTHYLLEDNRQFQAMAAKGVKTSALPQESAATKAVWHQRIGHPGNRLLQHLPKAVDHIKIIDEDQEGPKSTCEDCKLASASAQISREPMDRGSRPWQFVHFDIIPMQLSWDGYHTCFLHLYCPFTHFHEVRLMDNNGDVTRELKAFNQLFKTNGFNPQTYHTDGERSLGDRFEAHLSEARMQVH